jgi:pimeloyl-ACP methyl ester carboxylesterase
MKTKKFAAILVVLCFVELLTNSSSFAQVTPKPQRSRHVLRAGREDSRMLDLFGAGAPVPIAAQATESEQDARLGFENSACPIVFQSKLTVDCGVLTVPEDRVKNNGRTVRLPVAIVRTQSSRPAPDPVVLVTGGVANEVLPAVAGFVHSLPLAADRDVILYNQRGVGFSEPRLGCHEFDDIRAATFPPPGAPTPAQYLEAVEACHERLAGQGIDLDAYNSAEDAADLRDLRIELGYSEWNVYTFSAGGIIALTEMRLYPEGIRSVILDSALGNQYKIRGPDEWGAENRTLEKVFAGCAANATCETAFPDLRTRFYERVHAMRTNPAVVNIPIEGGGTFPFPVDGDQLLMDAALTSTDPGSVPGLPALMDAAGRGDIAGFYSGVVFSPDPPKDPMQSEGKTAVYRCHDYIPFEPDSELAQAADELPEFRTAFLTLRFIYVPTKTKEACKIWRVGRAWPAQHRPVTSSVPTLVLFGEWDVVSPEQGKKIARTLNNSFFFEFPGIGHVTQIWDACPQQIAGEFVNSPTASPDSSCISGMPALDFTPF